MVNNNDKLSLLRAHLNNDKQQIKEMLELFLDNLPNDLKELTLLCKKGDTQNIRKIAHKTKSSVKLFGLNEAGDMLQQIETMSSENDAKNQLETMVERLNQLMKHEFQSLRNDLARL